MGYFQPFSSSSSSQWNSDCKCQIAVSSLHSSLILLHRPLHSVWPGNSKAASNLGICKCVQIGVLSSRKWSCRWTSWPPWPLGNSYIFKYPSLLPKESILSTHVEKLHYSNLQIGFYLRGSCGAGESPPGAEEGSQSGFRMGRLHPPIFDRNLSCVCL